MRAWLLACCLWLAALASAGAEAQPSLRIALASTVDNTGLGERLAAGFARECACTLRHVAAGSTRALILLASGQVAAAITHAPKIEEQYLDGYGDGARIPFMQNEFIVVGPAADPAGVRGLGASAALAAIAAAGAPFVSRADGSGTNLAEIGLWEGALGAAPKSSPWYREAGVQMANALLVASQLGAYTLSDSGTFALLSASGVIASERLSAAAPPLVNTYSLILPPEADALAAQLAAWLRSDAAAAIIAGHAVAGEPLFAPLR